jgi:AcrR family transcriptional regulator
MTQEPAIVKGERGQNRRTQSERRAQTRAALIAAGRILFTEHGFAGAGREEIVEHAGLTRGALYHHFSSKEDLFAAVYEEVERDVCTAVVAAAATSGDPVEELRIGARAFLDAAAAPEVRRIMLLDGPAVLSPEVQHEIAQRYGLGLVREVLRAADAAGRLVVGPVDLLAPVLLAALHEAAESIADGADPVGMRAVVESLVNAITTTPTTTPTGTR